MKTVADIKPLEIIPGQHIAITKDEYQCYVSKNLITLDQRFSWPTSTIEYWSTAFFFTLVTSIVTACIYDALKFHFLAYCLTAVTLLLVNILIPLFAHVKEIRDHQRIWDSLPADERTWHEEYVLLFDEVSNFNRRLRAVQEFASVAERDELPDSDLVRKYAEERAMLEKKIERMRRKKTAIDHAAAHARAAAALQKVLGENDNGEFRKTRDVSDAVYAARVRIAADDREMSALTKPESPREEEFAELEESEAEQADRPRARAN
jgi:3-phenylpropionate/cinnamic acid dioxygenase small subunit